jgi:hypothetical protein
VAVQVSHNGSKETQLMHDVLVASSVNPVKQAWQLVELQVVQEEWYESHVMQFDAALTM